MFCSICGTQIVDGESSCSKCGASVNQSQFTQNADDSNISNTFNKMQMHCPRCGRTNLQVQSDSKITSSMSMGRAVGKRHVIGTTSYNTIKETYWFCSDCGMQFRDLDELRSLFTSEKKNSKVLGICNIILLILSVVLMVIINIAPSAAVIMFLPLLFIVFVAWILCMILYYWMTHDAKEKEKQYLDLEPKVWHTK